MRTSKVPLGRALCFQTYSWPSGATSIRALCDTIYINSMRACIYTAHKRTWRLGDENCVTHLDSGVFIVVSGSHSTKGWVWPCRVTQSSSLLNACTHTATITPRDTEFSCRTSRMVVVLCVWHCPGLPSSVLISYSGLPVAVSTAVPLRGLSVVYVMFISQRGLEIQVGGFEGEVAPASRLSDVVDGG